MKTFKSSFVAVALCVGAFGCSGQPGSEGIESVGQQSAAVSGIAADGTLLVDSSSENNSARLETLVIGGVSNVIFIDPKKGYLTFSGTFTAGFFEVLSSTPLPDGTTSVVMNHFFQTGLGGFINTHDAIILRPIPGVKDKVNVFIDYTVTASGGELAGYAGKFKGAGIIDTAANIANVRYSGTLTRRATPGGDPGPLGSSASSSPTAI